MDGEEYKHFLIQPRSFQRKFIYMHDNAPSRASRYAREFLDLKGFKKAKLTVWPLVSPDVNPIEILWSIVKRKLYEASKQYHSRNELKETIKPFSPETIKKLTSSMDEIATASTILSFTSMLILLIFC